MSKQQNISIKVKKQIKITTKFIPLLSSPNRPPYRHPKLNRHHNSPHPSRPQPHRPRRKSRPSRSTKRRTIAKARTRSNRTTAWSGRERRGGGRGERGTGALPGLTRELRRSDSFRFRCRRRRRRRRPRRKSPRRCGRARRRHRWGRSSPLPSEKAAAAVAIRRAVGRIGGDETRSGAEVNKGGVLPFY